MEEMSVRETKMREMQVMKRCKLYRHMSERFISEREREMYVEGT